jgi:hypothetical protein
MNEILREINSAYDINTMRINAVVEAANRQREINFHEAELKVMQESGTDDELAMLIEAAESDFVENIQKALDALRQAVIKFFSECRQKLVDLMSKRDDANKLDQLEKRMKLIPLIGKKKVMVEDYDAEIALAKKHLKDLAGLTAKLRGKQEVDASAVAAVKKSYDDAHGDLIGASNAKTVSINEAVKMAKKMIASGNAELKEREETALKACDDAKKDAEKANANVANQIANVICHICKTAQNDYHRCVNGIMASIKKAIGGYKAEQKTADKPGVKNESTDDSDAEMEKLAKQQDDTNSKDSVDEDADDDDIDLGFDVAGDDALTAGLGIDDVDSDDDTLDDLSIDDDEDEDEDECGQECGYECRESADDAYLAALAGVKLESADGSHDADYHSLMDDIMNL